LRDRGSVIPLASDVHQVPDSSDREQQLQLFGDRVRELRLKARRRQSDVADRAGLDRIAISNIERGLRDVGVVRATAITRALGVHPGDLFLPRSADRDLLRTDLPRVVQGPRRDLARLTSFQVAVPPAHLEADPTCQHVETFGGHRMHV
jgi:transcriptional regulator with XRE-family HTH domain